jgi:hypothetical protein
MFDGQSQTPRAGGPEHHPVGSFGEILVGQRVAEEFVVDPVVLDDDATLGNARGAAGLEDVGRLVGEPLRDPAADGAAAQPLILEQRELREIGERADLFARIEAQRFGSLQPERAAGLGVEVPLDRLAGVLVESFLGLRDECVKILGGCFLGMWWVVV